MSQQMIKRWFLGATHSCFYIGLVYLAPTHDSARWAFIALTGIIFGGTLLLHNEKKVLSRSGMPAAIDFPVDCAIGVYCVCLGGMMALAGVLLMLAGSMQLVIYGDVPNKEFKTEEV